MVIMAKLVTVSVLLISSALAVNSAILPEKEHLNGADSFVGPEEAKQILQKYPNYIKLNKTVVALTRNTNDPTSRAINYEIDYYFGEREKDDEEAYFVETYQKYPTPDETFVIVDYPVAGYGSTITSVGIAVDQTSPFGDAYLLFGNIGQRSIYIMVVALNTEYFGHRAIIFVEGK